jgi:tRNA pseudouridine65 synthase
MGHISHPIIGDTVHGDAKQNKFAREHSNFSKLAFCATNLSFTQPSTRPSTQPSKRPSTKKSTMCETALADDFQTLFAVFL